MQKITQITGKAIPLNMNDVDTDLIIPAQHLTSVSRAGYGKNLFGRLKESDPHFVFNRAEFQGANILISGQNFGCGSSREHAVWALQEAGMQAVIAVSFGDIFFNNSSKNGLLLIQLPEKDIHTLLKLAADGQCHIDINIAQQTVTVNAQTSFQFAIDPFRKHCLLQGLDDLEYLLSHQSQIEAFARRKFPSPPGRGVRGEGKQ